MNKRILFAVAISIISQISSGASHADTTANTAEIDTLPPKPLHLVGQGKLRWLMLDLYEATLRTPSGSYQSSAWPLTLELVYKRAFNRQQLIKGTEKSWQKQGIPYQQQWLTRLDEIWPNVNTNDSLLLSINDQGTSQFFYNQQAIGDVSDPKFSQAFAALWLSETTLYPTLRKQLIGLDP